MEKQYSVEFFASFVENLQNLCQMYLSYDELVEVSGYVSVEIDNTRKERYVLSEILQTTGTVLSESYCTKVSKNSAFSQRNSSVNCGRKALQEIHRNREKRNRQTDEDHSLTRASNFNDEVPELFSVEVPIKAMRMNQTERNSFRYQQEDGNLMIVQAYPQESTRIVPQDIVEVQSFHELDGQTSFGVRGQEHMEQISTLTSDTCESNKSSILVHSSSSVRVQPKRSWHVTKEEFPSESASSQSVVHCSQAEKEMTEDASRSFVTNVPESPLHDATSVHEDHSGTVGSSVTSEASCDVVTCKQEPGLDTSQDAVVYTDIDNDDGNLSQDYGDSKPSNPGLSDSERDFILIELDSDNEDFDDTAIGSDVSNLDPPTRDLSSFSKPQQFAVNRLIQFLKLKKIPGPACSLPPEQLDLVLAEFYQRVRKCGGQEFGSRSLKTIQQYLEIYFRSNNYPASITKSPQFQNSRDVMTAKVKQLKSHEESSLTLKREDVEQLYACGQLGDSTPEAIINTLWLMNTIRLNIKGCKKHVELKWGDIMLQTQSDGKEIIVYGGTNMCVQKNLRQPSRCFVNLYKKYWALRPQDTLDADSPFYLAPSEQGFKRSKYGTRIGTVFKRMLINAGLPSELKITNIDIL